MPKLRVGMPPANGVKKAIPLAAQVYKLFGVADHLQARYPDSGHDYPPPKVREEAYRFIDVTFAPQTPPHVIG